jgi:hypothetical protein
VLAAGVLGAGGVGAQAALTGQPHVYLPRLLPGLVVPSPLPLSPTLDQPPAGVSKAVAPPAKPVPDFAITVAGVVSWVRVALPTGRVVYAGMLRHGHVLTFARHPLTVTIGNAGAVRLVLHHRLQHAVAGSAGQVLTFTYR